MKFVSSSKPEQNQAAFDPWTVVHFAAGLAMGLMNVPGTWAFAASVVYEGAEQVFERHNWGQQFFEVSGPESLPNAFVDTAVLMSGHWMGRAWNRTG